jgi:hypothetical protein
MTSARLCLLAALLAGTTAASAFEADVHFGLTRWLALQAGFDDQSAETIAIGNQRVDSGDMQFLDLVLLYGCLNPEDLGSSRTSIHHYATSGAVPGPVQGRAVIVGGDSAQKAAGDVVKIPADQAHYRLFKLGEALHLLQDSWSHQGVPDVPQPATGVFSCDATRAWGHPAARGGWNSHKADLTMAWPADTRAMARASYDVLKQYPELTAAKRTPRTWDEVAAQLDGFIRASTKTEKKRWFAAHGIGDVSFLEGISLADGAQPFDLKWKGRKLPPLTDAVSRQHAVDPDLLAFFNRFFAKWVMTADFKALAAEFGPQGQPGGAAELEARLKLWRLRDHGRVASLAHARSLSDEQRTAIDTIGSQRSAYARYDDAAAAFYPLLPRGKDVSPLLPFYINAVAPDGKPARAVAILRFRHTPYDSLAVVAENSGGHWRVTAITATVDH